MLRRSAHRLAACTPMLHAIINGTASNGWKIRSRIAPATAEKAKPASPETNAPANTAALSSRFVARSVMMSIPDRPLEHDPEKYALGLDPRVGTDFASRQTRSAC